MEKLQQYLNRFESNFSSYETINSSVSKASVGWHIDHSLKVINVVCESLKNSNPVEYLWKFNKIRFIIYTIGFIPRGKGKAPKYVQSYETIIVEDLKSQLSEAKKNILEIKNFDRKSNFKHPLFGVLNLKQTLYFLDIHTKHHLKIIEDILRK